MEWIKEFLVQTGNMHGMQASLKLKDACDTAAGCYHQPNKRHYILGAIAAAMVGSIFSSDAWNNVTFIAGEIKNPKKNIGLSLFLGTLIVTVIYVLQI